MRMANHLKQILSEDSRRFIQKGNNDTWQIDVVELIPF